VIPEGSQKLDRRFEPGDLVIVQFELDAKNYIGRFLSDSNYYWKLFTMGGKIYTHEFNVILYSDYGSKEQIWVRFVTNTERERTAYTHDQVVFCSKV